MPDPIVITIDGPAGAGKSTVAKMLAARLGLSYVDSGATYRAAALKVIESGVTPDDEARVIEVVSRAEIAFEAAAGTSRVRLDGRDVTDKIRTSEVTLAAARVSRLPEVRKKLIGLQRALARGKGVVMEGRDIGTKVFPDADLKIFLDADPVIRERRRMDQQRAKGPSAEAMAAELRERDRRDRTRATSPLVAATDAVVLDSTHLSEDEVLRKIEELVDAKRGASRE